MMGSFYIDKALLHLIGHQGGDGAADLVVLRPFSQRAEQDEEEPARHETTLRTIFFTPKNG